MEESIRKAEELIEATNAALVQMQYESSLDDFSNLHGDKKLGVTKKSIFDEARRVLSPREKTLEMDDLFSLNKNSIKNDKLYQIINNIEAHGLLERESVKAFDVPATRTTSDTNLSQRTVTKINLSEDLKAKLQETQDVVNRGIQTARELNETVEVLRFNKQPITDRPEVPPHKSESVSTVKTVDVKRCKRCNAEITRKIGKQKDRKKEDNVLMTKVTGMDSSTPRRRRNLNYQQLPSLKIQCDLSCQRIPSVDIPPGKRECFPHRANASYETYSHEEIVGDKVDKIIAEIRSSNGFARSGHGKRQFVELWKSLECSNCGKVVRMCNKSVRTEEIDELLKVCDYNVYDPRIDEFVERLSGKAAGEAKGTQTEMEVMAKVEAEKLEPVEIPSPKRRPRLSDLSSELAKKYREKATELESDHLEFEGILRELFEKMDESRALLKNCDYLNTIGEAGKRKASLSVTPPVLLSYTGSGEEADDGRNAVLRPSRTQKSKLPAKVIRKKLEKKELEINCKLISSSCPTKGRTIYPEVEIKPTESSPPVLKPVGPLCDRDMTKKEVENRKMPKPSSSPLPVPAVKQISPVISSAEVKTSPPPEVNLSAVEESVKQMNTVSDYESDFEEESLERRSPEQAEDNSYKCNARLSTISEVESELDRKMSDLGITEGSNYSKELPRTVGEAPKLSRSSSDEDDTRKLLRKVNRDLKEVASQQLVPSKKDESLQKVSEDVAEPLKEVLNALKNQFERTELLADRLTESIKEVHEVKKPEEGLSNSQRDLLIVNNLVRVRKIAENGKPSPRSNLLRILREKSAREKEKAQEEIRSQSPSSASLSSKGSTCSEKRYSEGEISEQEILMSDRSSPSIGEVINENSDSPVSEEKSVIKFL